MYMYVILICSRLCYPVIVAFCLLVVNNDFDVRMIRGFVCPLALFPMCLDKLCSNIVKNFFYSI